MKTFKTKSKKPVTTLAIQLTALFAVLLLAFSGAGCLGQDSEDKTVVVSGSTTILPMAQTLSETYMGLHNDTIVSVKGGGSGAGISELIDGANDIAMSSREIKATEVTDARAKGVEPVEHEVAKDGIAVIVHPGNPISTLTLDQLQKIYSGEITNWKDLGGADAEIAAIARDSASGTQEFFVEAVMKDVSIRTDLITQSATGAVTQEVSQNPNAIGYIGAAYQSSSMKTLGIDENGTVTLPTEANILNGNYPLSRGLYLYTNSNAPNQAASDFIAFILSADGQQIVREVGYAPIN